MKLSTQIFLGFFIVISIDLLDSYVNYSLTGKVNTNTDFLTKSEAIIRHSSRLNRDIIGMQSAFRGFLLTGDGSFLLPYYNGLHNIPPLLNLEYKLVNSSQRVKLDSIRMLNRLWVNYANVIINEKKKAIANPHLANRYQYLFESQLKKQLGKSYNDQISAIFLSFDRNEYKVREDRRKALATSIQRTQTFSMFFSVMTIIIGLSSAFYLVTKISSRISLMVKLAEHISLGNFTQVKDNKHDELSSLSVSLNSMSDKLSRNISELKKRNDELNQFAYVVSHDLKAPIRGIYNVIQWIEEDLDGELSPEMRKYLEIIPNRIERMEDLIDGLLDYARISRDQLIKEQVDVTILVQEIAEGIMPKEYRLILKNLPKIFTEKLMLQQVFSNLISNAIKYTAHIHGVIDVSCIDKPDFYEFTVSDNGMGIEPEYHEKIFVIFQTLREKHDKESTGIGLAIVKKIIEDRHCTIKVVSTVGEGASFIFTWPKS